MSIVPAVARIAVVDTDDEFRTQVVQALISLYSVTGYSDVERALDGLRANPPAVILVDEKMAPKDGAHFIARLKREPLLANIPTVITLSQKASMVGMDFRSAGADGVLTRPFRRSSLIKTITALVNKKVEAGWENLRDHEKATLKGTVEAFNNISDYIASGEQVPFHSVQAACAPLVDAVAQNDFKGILNGVKMHDNYSYVHSLRVATLLSLFGHTLGVSKEDQLMLASGGLLHDAGKVSIPHEVLNKPGRLTEPEFVVMKSHVTETIKFLNLTPDMPKPVIIIAAQHHEKLDGNGYPYGLKGGELNDLARMASIVDVFSALTDRRVYKPPMEAEVALGIMTEQMANHLDQHFVALFRTMLMDAVIES